MCSFRINIIVNRLGGGYGAKITRANMIAVATGLAAYKLQQPVAMQMSFISNMDIIGKRFPTAAGYEVGVDDEGVIQYMDYKYYFDYSVGGNEMMAAYALNIMTTSYKHNTWNVSANHVNTDRHAACAARAPGILHNIIQGEHTNRYLNLKKDIVIRCKRSSRKQGSI